MLPALIGGTIGVVIAIGFLLFVGLAAYTLVGRLLEILQRPRHNDPDRGVSNDSGRPRP